jgi:hypothetical protein
MSHSISIESPQDTIAHRSLLLRRIFTVGAVGLVLTIALVLPLPMDGRAWGSVFDLAHAPSFFGTFLIIVGVLDPTAIGLRSRSIISLSVLQLVALAMTLGLFGIAAEFAQALVGRNPSMADVLANFSGLFGGLVLCLSRLLRGHSLRIATLALSALMVLTPSISPVLELRECLVQQREFPLLASFERPRELNAWNPHAAAISLSGDWSTDGRQSMKIDAGTGSRYPGATLTEPIRDWSGFDSFELDLRNPGTRHLEVGISITDEQHPKSGYAANDRFQEKFSVAPDTVLSVKIDLSDVAAALKGRQFLLDRILGVNVFLLEKIPGEVIYVDHLRLTKRLLSADSRKTSLP